MSLRSSLSVYPWAGGERVKRRRVNQSSLTPFGRCQPLGANQRTWWSANSCWPYPSWNMTTCLSASEADGSRINRQPKCDSLNSDVACFGMHVPPVGIARIKGPSFRERAASEREHTRDGTRQGGAPHVIASSRHSGVDLQCHLLID